MRRRGFTIVETLAAAFVLSISLMIMGALWGFSYNATASSIEITSAQIVGLQTLEQIRMKGFNYSAEGTSTLYYDKDLGGASSTQGPQHRYSVSTTISTDVMVFDPTTGSNVPADKSIRTVTVRVSKLQTGAVLFQAATYLVRSGI